MEFDALEEAAAAVQVLQNETFKGERIRATVRSEGKAVSIDVEAQDAVALRAALNSYLRHTQIMQTINEVNKNGE